MDPLEALAFFWFGVCGWGAGGVVSGKVFDAMMTCHVESSGFQSGYRTGQRSKIIRNER